MRRAFLIIIFACASTLLASRAGVAEDAAPGEGLKEAHIFATLPDLKRVRAINGIDFNKLDRFWETWKLINVRFRSDSLEQRFVYANPAAWKALQAGRTDYPDGAIFGKIAFYTEVDPVFPLSRESHGYDRIQIMKKDSKKFAATGGWGYAVVSPHPMSGEPTEDRNVAVSCHACHTLAAARGFVFTANAFSRSQPPPLADFAATFEERRIEDLNPRERKAIELLTSGRRGSVRYRSESLFAGSVNENIPVITAYAAREKAVYLLSDPASGFLVVAESSPKAGCPDGTRFLATLTMLKNAPRRQVIGVMQGAACEGRVTWQSVKDAADVF